MSTEAEDRWWLDECRRDIHGEDSWMPLLRLMLGNSKRITWAPGERESFEAFCAAAMEGWRSVERRA